MFPETFPNCFWAFPKVSTDEGNTKKCFQVFPTVSRCFRKCFQAFPASPPPSSCVFLGWWKRFQAFPKRFQLFPGVGWLGWVWCPLATSNVLPTTKTCRFGKKGWPLLHRTRGDGWVQPQLPPRRPGWRLPILMGGG